jgi:hypothetical protein
MSIGKTFIFAIKINCFLIGKDIMKFVYQYLF